MEFNEAGCKFVGYGPVVHIVAGAISAPSGPGVRGCPVLEMTQISQDDAECQCTPRFDVTDLVESPGPGEHKVVIAADDYGVAPEPRT